MSSTSQGALHHSAIKVNEFILSYCHRMGIAVV